MQQIEKKVQKQIRKEAKEQKFIDSLSKLGEIKAPISHIHV